MLNKVILIGRLTTNVELRYSNDQLPYCYFTLAVNRQNSKDKTDFISCVAFRTTAELMSKYLQKGSQISVEGRLEVYRSETNGEYQTRTNVVVNNIVFLDSKSSSNNKVNNNSTSEMMFSQDSIELNIGNKKDSSFVSEKDDSDEEFDFENFEIKI